MDNILCLMELMSKLLTFDENKLLTDKYELHYIQLPKFKRKCQRISTKLEQWLTFFINEEIKSMNNELVQKAEEELEYLNSDEEAQRLAYLREKAIRDEAAAMAGAYNRGKEEGREQGEKSKSFQIARKMLEEKIDIETIIRLTDLTKEEIEKL